MDATRFTAADLADTGQWRLILHIDEGGMSGWLATATPGDIPPGALFGARWADRRDNILKEIENTVYDHPRVLDDYSTDIILATDRVMWVPESELEVDNAEETIYTALFPTLGGEAMADTLGPVPALFTSGAGLKAFIGRTFAGARVRCQMSLTAAAACTPSSRARVIIDIRQGKADMVIADRGDFKAGVSHDWGAPADIVYHLFQLLDVLAVDASGADILLAGDPATAQAVADILSALPSLPAVAIHDSSSMPLSVALCAAKGDLQIFKTFSKL